MGDFVFKIKTAADLKALEAMQKSLQSAAAQTRAMGGDASQLEARLNGVNAALTSQAAAAVRTAGSLREVIAQTKSMGGNPAALQQQLNNLQSAHSIRGEGIMETLKGGGREILGEIPGGGAALSLLEKVGGKLGFIAAGLLVAKKSLSEFSQAQDVWASVDASLAQTQQLTEANREKINEYAGALQSLTGISDETWSAVMGDIVQFGGKVEDIEKHTEAVKNYAGLLKGDVASASDGYRKALAGNFMMFTRLGFEVDKNASKTENIARLWEFLAQKGGGQLEARAKTLTGQMSLMKNNVGDVFEAFGRLLAQTGVAQRFLGATAGAAGFLANMLGGVPPQADGLANALPTLSKRALAAKKSIEGAATAATEMGGDMADSATGVGSMAAKAKSVAEEFNKASAAMQTHRVEIAALIDAQKEAALAQINLEEAMSPDKSPKAKAAFAQQRAQVEGKADEQKSALEAADLQAQFEAAGFKRDELTKATALAEVEARDAKNRAAAIAGKETAAGVRPDMTRAEFDKLRSLRAAELARAEEELPTLAGPYGLQKFSNLSKEIEARKQQLAVMDEIRDKFLEMTEAEAAYKAALAAGAKGLADVAKEIERITRDWAILQAKRDKDRTERSTATAKTSETFTKEQRAEAQKILEAQKQHIENSLAGGVDEKGKLLTPAARAALQTKVREKAIQIEAAKVNDDTSPAERQLAREAIAALRNKFSEENRKLLDQGLNGPALPIIPKPISIVGSGPQPIPGFRPGGLPPLPSGGQPASSGFDPRPPGYVPPAPKIGPVETDANGVPLPPRFSGVQRQWPSAGGGEGAHSRELESLTRETTRQLAQFTSGTLRLVQSMNQELHQANRKLVTMGEQFRNSRDRV